MHKRIKVLQNISNGSKDNWLCSHWTRRIFRRHGHEQPKKKILGCKFTQEERIDIKTKGERIVSSLSEKL